MLDAASGTVAAPAFREIARQTMAYLHVPPDAPGDFRDGVFGENRLMRAMESADPQMHDARLERSGIESRPLHRGWQPEQRRCA